MNIQQQGIILLIYSALTGEKVEIPKDFDFEEAYKCAKTHRILPLVYYGIVNSEIVIEESINDNFFSGVCRAIMVNQKQNFSISQISKAFELNKIDFMMLKGSIIKELYPRPEMRNMGDVDILFRAKQYDKIVPILENMGMTFVKENENEIAWEDYPFYLELHRYLIAPQHKDYFEYFGDGWDLAKLSEGSSYRYIMSDEDYYIFLFAHLTKHYRFSGIGIKHFVDVWVYLNAKPELNMKYIEDEFKKLKMYKFHKNVIKTVNWWFKGTPGDDITELITSKVFNSGAFGTYEAARSAATVKGINNSFIKNPRLNQFLFTLFLPYKNMCKLFPVLNKLPFLLPLLWLWRIIYTLLFKKGNLKEQYNGVRKLSSENVFKYEKELEAVGLDFNFKE